MKIERTGVTRAALILGGLVAGLASEHPSRGRGIRVPTLEAVLDAFPEARMNIDLKETDPVLIERLIDAGVSGIITDRPDLLLDLLGRR